MSIKAAAQDQFNQLKKECRLEEKVKGSRFIASARPVAGENEAVAYIEEIRKEFHDATHNAFAWRVGVARSQRYRYSDDGEPSGTAGQPILRAIEARGLSNVCVVVTRYFGGVKLGSGGLVRAYSRVAAEALKNCEYEKKFFTENIAFSIGFDFVNVVHNIINSLGAEVKDSQYGDRVRFLVEVRASQAQAFRNKLTDGTNGQVEFE